MATLQKKQTVGVRLDGEAVVSLDDIRAKRRPMPSRSKVLREAVDAYLKAQEAAQ